MTLVCFANGKGAPGATTAMLASASLWPMARRLVVEADADGGVLAARFGLGYEPGLVTLAAAGRRSLSEADLFEHTQPLADGVSAICGPTASEQATAALAGLAPLLARRLALLGGVGVFVDIGRADAGSSAGEFAAAADVTLLVSRPRLDELQQLESRLRGFRARGVRVGVVLVGEQPYGCDDVAAFLDPSASGLFVEAVADDPRGAQAVSGWREPVSWSLRRTALLRTAAGLVDRLIDDLGVRERAGRVDGKRLRWPAGMSTAGTSHASEPGRTPA